MRVWLKRAMVLRQPWAQDVAEGAFPVLIRSQPTRIREHVGILSATRPDPLGYPAELGEALGRPLGAIIGAVEIVGSVELEGDARAFLANRFDKTLARAYPERFIPDRETKHVWVLGEAIPAETPREWEKHMPRTWGRCRTWIEGEPVPLLELETSTA